MFHITIVPLCHSQIPICVFLILLLSALPCVSHRFIPFSHCVPTVRSEFPLPLSPCVLSPPGIPSPPSVRCPPYRCPLVSPLPLVSSLPLLAGVPLAAMVAVPTAITLLTLQDERTRVAQWYSILENPMVQL